jgi:hypothetical protein
MFISADVGLCNENPPVPQIYGYFSFFFACIYAVHEADGRTNERGEKSVLGAKTGNCRLQVLWIFCSIPATLGIKWRIKVFLLHRNRKTKRTRRRVKQTCGVWDKAIMVALLCWKKTKYTCTFAVCLMFNLIEWFSFTFGSFYQNSLGNWFLMFLLHYCRIDIPKWEWKNCYVLYYL